MIHPSEMSFFVTVAGASSLGEAARDLGVTVAAVSKRLSQIEARTGAVLVTRTVRRLALTPEGEVFLGYARRILDEIDELEHALGKSQQALRGLIRISASPGFGRLHVAPAIASFSALHPQVEVRLTLSENVPALSDDVYDVLIQFGEPPESRVIARHLAANQRVICASPAYLAARGVPRVPADLAAHDCIDLRQAGHSYGVWRFTPADRPDAPQESIRIKGALATNDGPTSVDWALAGRGIVMRATWNVARHLATGALVRVLEDWRTPDASIYAIYPQQHRASQRIRAFVDHLGGSLGGIAGDGRPGG